MPTPSQLHVNTVITNGAAMLPMSSTYICEGVFPRMSVDKQSNIIPTIDPTGRLFRARSDIRSPGARAQTMDIGTDLTNTYFCQDHAIDMPLTDEEVGNVDPGLRAAINKAAMALKVILNNKEIAAVASVDAYFTGSLLDSTAQNWGSTSVDPVADINAAIALIEDFSLRTPNTINMDIKLARILCNHPALQSRAGIYAAPNTSATELQAGIAGYKAMLSFIFGFDFVNIAKNASYNTATADDATFAGSSIWGERVLLSFTEPINEMTGATGATVVWNSGVPGAAGESGILVRSIRDELAASTIMRAEQYYDIRMLRSTAFKAQTCGYLFSDTITP